MRFILDHHVTLKGASSATREQIKTRLTLANPRYEDARKMGRFTRGIPPKLHYFSEAGEDLVCPRGFSDRAWRICRAMETVVTVEDNRRSLDDTTIHFTGRLRPYQAQAVDAMMPHTHGTLSAPTGSGKTVMALALIARRHQPVLIIVHTRELLNQWITAIEAFLGISPETVGVLGAGKAWCGEQITVALVQTLKNRWETVQPHVGHVIVDECHKCPARTFTDVLTRFDARFLTGLSATPWRRDRLTPSIYFHMGELRHEVPRDPLFSEGSLIKPRIILCETGFESDLDPSRHYSTMLKVLTRNLERNRLVARDVASVNRSGIRLVLSDRREHCRRLSQMLATEFGCSTLVLTGDTPAKERDAGIETLKSASTGILIATIALLSEGFDLPELSTLFLTTPIRSSGRLLQCLGRVLRPAPGKETAIVYDYVDARVGVLDNAARSRQQVYRDMGAEITGLSPSRPETVPGALSGPG